MTIIESLRQALKDIELNICHCITDDGYIESHHRYEYQNLMKASEHINWCIKYFEERDNDN